MTGMSRWMNLALLGALCGCKSAAVDEWAKRPMHEVHGNTCIRDACTGIPFTIQVPDGLEPEPATASVGIGGHYRPDRARSDALIDVVVDACAPAATRDAWMAQPHPDDHPKIDREDRLPDGFLIASRATSYADSSARAIHVKGDKALCCHAYFTERDHEVGEPARQMLTTICSSLQLL